MDIRNIRKETGLTQKAFAKKYHISYQTIKQWECRPESKSHRNPPVYVLFMLQRLVEIDFGANHGQTQTGKK